MESNSKELNKIKFEILGIKLSTGSYQNEQGRFEFPIDITMDDSGRIVFDVFLNCEKSEIDQNISILNDEISIVFAAIESLFNELYVDKKLDDCINGYLYNYYGPKPIAYWKGKTFFLATQ